MPRVTGIVRRTDHILGCATSALWPTTAHRAIHHDRGIGQTKDQDKKSNGVVDSSQKTVGLDNPKPTKTIAQLDKELEEKLAGRAGDGGAAAIEYEDGKPVAMKRSVKNNMFRYI